MSIRIGLRVSTWTVYVFLLVAPSLLSTQAVSPPGGSSPGSQPETLPAFRATARLVLLDVVATDQQRTFIRGLKANDFTVLEDSKPQSISGFAMHAAVPASKNVVPQLHLPPHQYTKFSFIAQAPDLPVTIVLLDMLNTSGQGQQYARKQMIQFLKALPSGRPTALFTLTSKLRMVQGFTGDSSALVKAATETFPQSPLLTSPETQTQQEEVTARSLETIGASPPTQGPSGQSQPVRGSSATIAPIGQAIRDALASQDSFQKAERMGLTISALDVLARSVAGYSGRKNLVWLSAEFPIAFGPTLNPYNQAGAPLNQNRPYTSNHQIRDVHSDTPAVEHTAALLAAAQVAVYPIDVSGVINPGSGIDISTSTAGDLSNFDISNETQNASLRQTTTTWDAHEAMSDIARETGGHAFYGTNDLKDAMSHAMDEGSGYYTLAYVPTNHKWNGNYRKIEVKLVHPGVQLTYRRGYYSLQERQDSGDRAAAVMASAMKLSVPEYTMLVLKVQVLPPDAEHKTVRIDYAVDARDIAFADGPDQRELATLDFVATAWGQGPQADRASIRHHEHDPTSGVLPACHDQRASVPSGTRPETRSVHSSGRCVGSHQREDRHCRRPADHSAEPKLCALTRRPKQIIRNVCSDRIQT